MSLARDDADVGQRVVDGFGTRDAVTCTVGWIAPRRRARRRRGEQQAEKRKDDATSKTPRSHTRVSQAWWRIVGMAEGGRRLMPARCPPQRLEPLRRMRVDRIRLRSQARIPRRNRRPVSGLAGEATTDRARRPDRLPASCSGVEIRFGLLTVAGAAPELRVRSWKTAHLAPASRFTLVTPDGGQRHLWRRGV